MRARLPFDYELDEHNVDEKTPGHLEWFDTMPTEILPIQECYKNDWEMLKDRIKKQKMEER